MATTHLTIEGLIEARSLRGVKSASEGDRKFENDSIPELIMLEKHLAAKVAAAKPHFGLRMTKLIPPGGG